MTRPNRPFLVVLAIVAGLAMVAGACGDDDDDVSTADGAESGAQAADADADEGEDGGDEGEGGVDAVSSRQDDGGADGERTDAVDPLSELSFPDDADDYVGLTKDEALDKADDDGREARIIREDDDFPMITDDLRTNRINLEIDDGVVTAAEYG